MISEISVISGSIPLTKTDPEQMWIVEWSNQIFVRVQTSDDFIGWGEVLPAAGNMRDPYISLINRLKELLIGEDESRHLELWNKMRKATFIGGYGVTTGAISGIDTAIWDVNGKRANISVCKMLGSEPKKSKRYVSLSRYRMNDLKPIFNNLLESSYRAIKLHQPARETIDSIRLVRSEVGNDFELMVDLNCGFDYEKAKDFMNQVQRFELKWIEEPLWPPDDFESLAKLNKLGSVAAGENFFSYFEFKRLLELEALSFYQPDVAKIGGITPMVDIIRLLEANNAKIAFHNRPHNGWVSTIASSQLACTTKAECLVETPPNEIPEQYFSSFPKLSKSEMHVSDEPGLGISLAEPVPESNESKLLRFH